MAGYEKKRIWHGQNKGEKYEIGNNIKQICIGQVVTKTMMEHVPAFLLFQSIAALADWGPVASISKSTFPSDTSSSNAAVSPSLAVNGQVFQADKSSWRDEQKPSSSAQASWKSSVATGPPRAF